MLFADKLGMPKKIKDLAESLDLEVTNHHDPEFDAKLCALIFGELTDKYPSYQELIRKIDDQPKTNNNYFNQPSEDVLEENEEHLSNYQITQNELENIDLIGKGIVITGNFSIEREEIKTFLMKIGGQIKSGITGKVDFVFAGEDCGWSKIQKINDLNQSKKANIRILNEALHAAAQQVQEVGGKQEQTVVPHAGGCEPVQPDRRGGSHRLGTGQAGRNRGTECSRPAD